MPTHHYVTKAIDVEDVLEELLRPMGPPSNICVALPIGTFGTIEYKEWSDGHARKRITASPVASGLWIFRIPPSFLHSPDPITEEEGWDARNTDQYERKLDVIGCTGLTWHQSLPRACDLRADLQ